MRRIIFYIFVTVVLIGCSTGKDAQNQTSLQNSRTMTGDTQNITSHKDTIVGDEITVNNYGGFNEEQFKNELQKRDKSIADLEAKLAPRTLDAQMSAELERCLQKEKHVSVRVDPAGGAETSEYAQQIKNYLEGRDYNVAGIGTRSSTVFYGMRIEPEGDGFQVVVGIKPPVGTTSRLC
jgi:hypothetical protein